MWIYSFYLFLINGIITYKIFHFSKKNSPELTSKYFIYNDLKISNIKFFFQYHLYLIMKKEDYIFQIF